MISNALMILQVMLHTFMDCLREDGSREINHHGKTVTVTDGGDKMFQRTNKVTTSDDIPTFEAMTQRNEKDLVEARKEFYQRVVTFRMDYLEFCQFAAKKGIPIIILVFSVLYWSYGLFSFFNPSV